MSRKTAPCAYFIQPSIGNGACAEVTRYNSCQFRRDSALPPALLRLYVRKEIGANPPVLHRKNSSLIQAFLDDLLCIPDEPLTSRQHPGDSEVLSPMSLYYSNTQIPPTNNGKSRLRVPRGWFFLAPSKYSYTIVIDVPSLQRLHAVAESRNPDITDDNIRTSQQISSSPHESKGTISIVTAGNRVLSAKFFEGFPSSSFAWSIGLRWTGGGGRLRVKFYQAIETSLTAEREQPWYQTQQGKWLKAGREIPKTEISVGLFSSGEIGNTLGIPKNISATFEKRGTKRSLEDNGMGSLSPERRKEQRKGKRKGEDMSTKRSRPSVQFEKSG